MNTTATTLDETNEPIELKPGACLAATREAKGYSKDYVAGKLHLRVKLIELLEADDYEKMPEPVFIKGYFRAYANLMEVDPEPLLAIFNGSYHQERKVDKALLWQSRRESNHVEHTIRWVTAIVAIGVLIAVAFWWHNNKENEQLFSSASAQFEKAANHPSDSEIRLTDLSKMRSLLSSESQYKSVDKKHELGRLK